MKIDFKFLFFISFILLIILFYYISSNHLDPRIRKNNIEIFNFIIPIFGIFMILTAFLRYFDTTKQTRDQRELQFAFNNETRIQNIINDITSCQDTKSKDFCSKIFKTQDEAFAFYILSSLENSLIQRDFKATSKYDVAWLNKIRKFFKENDSFIQYWENNKNYFSSKTNQWVEFEIENNFMPKFFPDQ